MSECQVLHTQSAANSRLTYWHFGQQKSQFVGIDRLHEMVIEACSQSSLPIVALPVSRQRDEQDPLQLRLLAQSSCQFVAVDARHTNVGDDDVGSIVLGKRQRG